jgi:putative transposase
MQKLFVNSVIEYRNECLEVIAKERVLWIAPDYSELVAINVDDEKAWPEVKKIMDIEEQMIAGNARKLPNGLSNDPDQDWNEKELAMRDRAWNIIKDIVEREPYVYDRSERYEMVKNACSQHKTTKKYVYKYLRNYWVGGKRKNALIPNYRMCGVFKDPEAQRTFVEGKKPGPQSRLEEQHNITAGVPLNSMIRKIFDDALDEFYENKRRNSLRFAYDQMLNKFFSTKDSETGDRRSIVPGVTLEELSNQVPTFDQFRYHFRKTRSPKGLINSRSGEHEFNLKHRPKTANAIDRAYGGPGAIYEIDATIADYFLVSTAARTQIIGRPVVHLVADVFSRMITGVNVSLEGPSWQGAMMALENATTNKVEFCKQYGLDISEDEWPSHYLPQAIFGDRGEVESYNANSLVDGLDVDVKNSPPYRADYKGVIEQRFRTINIKLGPWVPGQAKKEFQTRGSKDPMLDARLSLYGFTRALIVMIIHYNNNHYNKDYPLTKEMINDGVKPIPIELWNWGIANRSGCLREVDSNTIKINLLPTHKVTATDEGIYFKGMYYGNPELEAQGWFIKGHSIKTEIAYDRRCMNHVYVKLNKGRNFIRCELLPKSQLFKNLSLEECLEMQEELKLQRDSYEIVEQNTKNDLSKYYDKVINEDIAITEQELSKESPTNTEFKSDMKNKRKEAQKQLSREQAWTIGDQSEETNIVDPVEASEEEHVPVRRSKFDLIKKVVGGN